MGVMQSCKVLNSIWRLQPSYRVGTTCDIMQRVTALTGLQQTHIHTACLNAAFALTTHGSEMSPVQMDTHASWRFSTQAGA